MQSPLGKLLSQKFGAVNFSIRWCQVDLSQQKCLCFDMDIKHEDALPLLLNCGLYQVATQHQCPSAEAFRAEFLLMEIETRWNHWNKVVAQQMIPKEGSYESTPVCAKPSYWRRRDDGEFIHEFTWKWTAYVE